jgi:cobalamin biosynthesis protein CobT
MSRDYNVDVRFAGIGASTNGETIFLPANSDHLSDDGKLKVHALLDHERLHVAEEKLAAEIRAEKVPRPASRFASDAGPYRSPLALFSSARTQTRKMMFNVFEDIRIEHRVSQAEVGTAENLLWLNQQYASTFNGRSNFWREIGTIIIFSARGLAIPNLTDTRRKFIDALAPEIRDSTRAVTPADALELARRAEQKVRDLHEEQKREAAEREDDEGDSDEDEDDGEPSEDDGEPSEGDGEPSEDDGEPSEGEGEGDGEPSEGEGEGDGEPSEGEGEDDGEPSEGEATGVPAQGDPIDGNTSLKPEDFQGIEGDSDTDDIVNETRDEVKSEAERDAFDNNRYIPHPRAQMLDEIRDAVTHPGAELEYDEILNEVRPVISTLTSRLRRIFRARGQTYVSGDRLSGSIDQSVLCTIRTGNRRIYTERSLGKTNSIVFALAIDLSGSMGTSRRLSAPGNTGIRLRRMHYAVRAAIALSETLDALRVPFEIFGYQSVRPPVLLNRNERMRFGRVCPLDIRIFKSFDERLKLARRRMGIISGGGSNVDGESIRIAADRLATRREARKIMIVISDGSPAELGNSMAIRSDLHEAVKDVASTGIELFGIGVQNEYVRKYYSAKNGAAGCVVVNDVTTLSDTVLELFEGVVLRKNERN